MVIENLKNLLGVTDDVSEKELYSDELVEKINSLRKSRKEKQKLIEVMEKEREQINKLFYYVLQDRVKLNDKFKMYFVTQYVDDSFDDEFKDEKEEFFHNSGESFLVFEDKESFKVKFKIRSLKEYRYEDVCKVVKKAIKYSKEHPEISNYKSYYD